MKQENFLFGHLRDQSYDAATRIIPLLTEIIGRPESVLDLGGGTGGWCAAFKENGVTEVHCVDHPTARQSDLLVSDNEFIACDLDNRVPKVRKVDLALCIEVLEHLPPDRGLKAVNYLTKCSDVILFSAAIPGQGGTGHINEQWPDYWKSAFEDLGYECFDYIRPSIISDANIPYWLRQNIRIFARPEEIDNHPYESRSLIGNEFYLIHKSIAEKEITLYEAFTSLPNAIKNFVLFNLNKNQG